MPAWVAGEISGRKREWSLLADECCCCFSVGDWEQVEADIQGIFPRVAAQPTTKYRRPATIRPATNLFQAPRQSGPLNWGSANTKIKREKTGRGKDSVPTFFLFAAPPTFRTPFLSSSPHYLRILEQANQLRVRSKSETTGMPEEACQRVKRLWPRAARLEIVRKIKNDGPHDGGLRMLIDFEKVFCIQTIHIYFDRLRHQI